MRRRSDTLQGSMWRPDRTLEQPDVPRDLSPEERRKLEEFIRWADDTAESLPPPVRSRLEGDRKIATLILRVTGAAGTEVDRRELAELLQVQIPAPWSWVARERGMGYRQWTDDRVPRNTDERRHRRQKDLGIQAVLGWIGHPAVALEVDAARLQLSALVAPLRMPDQGIVTFVTADFLDCVSVYPDGSEWPDPFAGAPTEIIEMAEQIQPMFVAHLKKLAARIETAGAPLDPNDPAVLLVLSQLALLRVALDRPSAEIAADLNIWPPGSIDRAAASLGQVAIHASRHGRTARFQADLAAGAEAVALRLGRRSIHPPYAGGRQRATRSDTRQLRDALVTLVQQDPSLTPASLMRMDHGHDHPAMHQLRTILGTKDGWVPDQRRLERNWPKPRQ
jgi:hypothetical protein